MKYQSSIIFETPDALKIYAVLKPEEGRRERSDVTINVEQGKILFLINANDAVALKASLSGVIKALTIVEKTSALKNDKGNR